MEILHLERNNKRAEMKQAGEDNISDDEEDKLSPYISGLLTPGPRVPGDEI
jgi:hypothetical protein